MYRLAMANGNVAVNPARGVRHRRENNGRLRFLTEAEESALRMAILDKHRWHLPEFEIALHTGMRRSEQYGLTWQNVDLDERRITVPQSKNGEVRYVRLNSKALAILRGLHERSGGLGPVFID